MDRVKVICFGNALHGDDGFGPAAGRRLRERPLPPNVEVLDAGTAGSAAAFLFEDCERAVVVDAVRGYGRPGDLVRWAIDLSAEASTTVRVPASSHGLGLEHLLQTLPIALEGEPLPQICVVGAEVDVTSFGTPMSTAMQAAVPKAVDAILDVVRAEGLVSEGELDR